MLHRLPILVVGLLASGCVSYWKGQEMQTEITALQGQVEQLQESQRAAREKTQQNLATLSERFAEIETQLKEAIQRLQQTGADTGLLVQQLQEKIAELQGKLAEQRRQLGEGGGVGIPPPAAPPGAPPLPDNAAALYRYGWEKKNSNECPEAIRAFATFARQYPQNTRADNAIYLMAECQHQQQDYTGSIRSLQTILQRYGKGDKVDDSLVLMHDNFVALKRCKDALPFLETLLADYPRSDRAPEAREKLEQTKRKCR